MNGAAAFHFVGLTRHESRSASQQHSCWQGQRPQDADAATPADCYRSPTWAYLIFLSRASAALTAGQVFCLPGSPACCSLAGVPVLTSPVVLSPSATSMGPLFNTPGWTVDLLLTGTSSLKFTSKLHKCTSTHTVSRENVSPPTPSLPITFLATSWHLSPQL